MVCPCWVLVIKTEAQSILTAVAPIFNQTVVWFTSLCSPCSTSAMCVLGRCENHSFKPRFTLLREFGL